MIIKPNYRGFICLTAHPTGCYKNVEDMVKKAKSAPIAPAKNPKNVLVLGCSAGYGLASRVAAAFSCGAKTVGVAYEKECDGKPGRTATAGFYNNRAFMELAGDKNHITLNGDAFSDDIKEKTAEACKKLFGGEKIDLLVYSLAAPRRTDPKTGEVFSSVIKPVGKPYSGKTVDFHTGEVKEVTIDPATDAEAAATVKVMGGEDWYLWIEKLKADGLLAEGFTTVNYSYIGPELTHAIYKNGTIGRAKDDMLIYREKIDKLLKPLNGGAKVSVNKAVVTQASSAIPVVPLYISLLFKIMKEKSLHEGCYEQIHRLFADKLFGNENIIRMDDYEMRADVQAEITASWPLIDSENISRMTDIEGYRREFFGLFGFMRGDVDYDAEVEP